MISVEHLTKCYGEFKAVDDLSFEIDEGHVYGFLGPNGAGKSTTMNIITGCLSPTDGKVSIDGHDIMEEPSIAKAMIGYLPEIPPLYLNETPGEYLYFVAQAKGIKKSELEQQMDEVMEKTGISKVQNKLISALSKGYKQRVGIAQALLGNPKVIILDEPTVGLDPIQIIEIRDLVKKLGEEHTVIFSSHILSEVQAICDSILIISKGRLVAFETPEKLEKMMTQGNGIDIGVMGEKEKIENILISIEEIQQWEVSKLDEPYCRVHISTDVEDARPLCCRLFDAFAEKKLPIYEMSVRKANLEEVFLELTDSDIETETIESDKEGIEANTDTDIVLQNESEVKEN